MENSNSWQAETLNFISKYYINSANMNASLSILDLSLFKAALCRHDASKAASQIFLLVTQVSPGTHVTYS